MLEVGEVHSANIGKICITIECTGHMMAARCVAGELGRWEEQVMIGVMPGLYYSRSRRDPLSRLQGPLVTVLPQEG